MDDERELSKEDETPSQWIPKLKKGPKPRLITIHNRTSLNLERVFYSEQKGSWRRKPPLRIRQKSTEQFGVEGKVSRKINDISREFNVEESSNI
jgi:hypothetical protein